MSYTTDAAESVIRITLNGAERLLRVTGRGAVDLTRLLRAVLQNKRSGPGKERIQDFLSTGRNVKIFRLPKSLLKAFTCEAKRYGVRFAAVKNRDDKENPTLDILVSESEGPKVCRILDKCREGKADLSRLEAEALEEAKRYMEEQKVQRVQKQKTDPAGHIIDSLVPTGPEETPPDPLFGAAGRNPLSAPFFKSSERPDDPVGFKKPSVRQALVSLRREKDREDAEGLRFERQVFGKDGDRER